MLLEHLHHCVHCRNLHLIGYEHFTELSELMLKTDANVYAHCQLLGLIDRFFLCFMYEATTCFICYMAWPCALFWPLSHFQEESPLSVSSPDSIGTWLHYTCGVGTGRRRRRSGDQITSSPVSPKSLAFTSSIFGSWQQVFTPFNSLPSHSKKIKADSSFARLCLRGMKLSQGLLISRSM